MAKEQRPVGGAYEISNQDLKHEGCSKCKSPAEKCPHCPRMLGTCQHTDETAKERCSHPMPPLKGEDAPGMVHATFEAMANFKETDGKVLFCPIQGIGYGTVPDLTAGGGFRTRDSHIHSLKFIPTYIHSSYLLWLQCMLQMCECLGYGRCGKAAALENDLWKVSQCTRMVQRCTSAAP